MLEEIFVRVPIRIRQATAQGWIECPPMGVYDASYPTSKLRRGRVQGEGAVMPAITSQGAQYLRVYEGVLLRLSGA